MKIEKGGSLMSRGEPKEVKIVDERFVVLAGWITLTHRQAERLLYSPPADAQKSNAPDPVQGRLL